MLRSRHVQAMTQYQDATTKDKEIITRYQIVHMSTWEKGGIYLAQDYGVVCAEDGPRRHVDDSMPEPEPQGLHYSTPTSFSAAPRAGLQCILSRCRCRHSTQSCHRHLRMPKTHVPRRAAVEAAGRSLVASEDGVRACMHASAQQLACSDVVSRRRRTTSEELLAKKIP